MNKSTFGCYRLSIQQNIESHPERDNKQTKQKCNLENSEKKDNVKYANNAI